LPGVPCPLELSRFTRIGAFGGVAGALSRFTLVHRNFHGRFWLLPVVARFRVCGSSAISVLIAGDLV